MLPLLDNIEESIKLQRLNSNHISSITLNGQYISNISIDSLQQIELQEEDIAILRSVKDVLRLMYDRFIANSLRQENVLKKLFRFLKEFEISPYLLNTKSAFMIFYFTSVSLCRPEEVQIMDGNEGKASKKNHLLRQSMISTNPAMMMMVQQ